MMAIFLLFRACLKRKYFFQALFFGLFLFLGVVATANIASAAWYNSSWGYRLPITITNNTTSTLTNFQTQVSTTYKSNMNADFSDIRFTDSDQTTVLNYWTETSTASNLATFWVKVPSVVTSSIATIYMYYGNAATTTASNIGNTFLFGDDFSGTLDTSKWTTNGLPSNSSGALSLTGAGDGVWATNYSLPTSSIMEALVKKSDASTGRVGGYTSDSKFLAQIGAMANDTGIELLYHSVASTVYAQSNDGTTRSFNTVTSSYSTNWHRDTFQFQAGSRVDYTHNGVTSTLSTTVPAASVIHPEISNTNGTLNADWIFVRERANIEPSFSLGSEEASSTVNICTFASAGTNDFNTAGNWSCGHIPGSADDVFIPAATTTNLSASIAEIKSLTASGTINLVTSTLTVSTTLTVPSGGTVTSTSGILTVNGAATSSGAIGTVNGGFSFGSTVRNNGTFNLGAGTVTSTGTFTNASGGILNLGSGMLELGADFAGSGGTFNGQTGTLLFFGSATQSFSGAGGIYHLTLQKTAGSVGSGGDISVGGNLNLFGTGGTLDVGGQSLRVMATTTVFSGTTISSSGSTMTFTGAVTSTGTISPGGANVLFSSTFQNNGTLNVGSGTATSTGALTNSGTINNNTGTLVILNSFTNTGVFTKNTGTVRYQSNSDQTIASTIYYNLTLSGTSTSTLSVTTTVSNTLTNSANHTLAVGAAILTAPGTFSNAGRVTISTGQIIHAAELIEFTDSGGTATTTYSTPSSVYVKLTDPNRNLDATAVETVTTTIAVNAAGGGDSEVVTLQETTVSSGIFLNTTGLSLTASAATTSNNGTLELAASSTATAAYVDIYDSSDATSTPTAATLVYVASAVNNPPTSAATSTIATSSIAITWVAPVSAGSETYFVVEKSTDGISYTQAATTTTSTLNYTFSNLSLNTRHWFRVASGDGVSATSSYSTTSPAYTLAITPSAPTNGVPTSSTIPLTINGNGNPTSTTYAIFNTTTGQYLDNTGATTTNATFFTTSTWNSGSAINLTPSTSYQFVVIAKNGDGTLTATSSASTATSTLAASPTSPVVSSVSTSTLTLSWGQNNNPASVLYRVTAPGYATSSATGSSANLTGLTPNTSYTFSVASENPDGTWNSAVAAGVTSTLSLGNSAPTNAAVSVASITTSSINITWSAPASPGSETFYSLEKSTDGVTFTQFATTTTSTLTATSTNLSLNTRHWFRVASGDGVSATSSYSTTSPAYTLAITPLAPTLSSVATSSLALVINVNNNPAATNFSIQETNSGNYAQADGSLGATEVFDTAGNWGTKTITGLTANTVYTFATRGKNGDNTTTSLSATSATTTLANNPTTPTFSSVSTSTLTVTWTANSNAASPSTTYRVSGDNGFVSVTTTALTRALTGLTPNTSYTFTVAALNNNDGVTYTSGVSAATTTVALPLINNQPTQPTITNLTSSTLTVNWTSGLGDETDFEVWKSTDNSTFSVMTTTLATTTLNYLVTGLTPSTTYYFEVVASGNSVASATSSVSTATSTIAANPTNPITSVVSTSTLTLSWGQNNNPASVLYRVTAPGYATSSATGSSANLTGLTPNTSYTFSVASENPDGTWNSAVAAGATTTFSNPTAALTAQADSTSKITLTWSGDSTEYYATNDTLGTNSGWISATTVAFNNLSCGTVYNFSVRGRSGVGVETARVSAAATTKLCVGFSAPAAVAASIIAPSVVFSPVFNAIVSSSTTATITSPMVPIIEVTTPPTTTSALNQSVSRATITPLQRPILTVVKRLDTKKPLLTGRKYSFVYQFENATKRTKIIRLTRELLASNGRVVRSISRVKMIPSGKKVVVYVNEILSKKLATGIYTMRVRALEQQKVTATFSFKVPVVGLKKK